MSAPRCRAIIVDDELLAREGLATDISALGVDVVAVCADGHAARRAIAELHPEILLLDIQMPEVDGFAVLETLEPEDRPPAIIFVTAFDQHAVRAFEARALDYLLKPVSPERLCKAIERAERRVGEARAFRDSAASLDEPRPTAEYLKQLSVRDRDETTIIPVHDLEWIEAETYYVRLHAQGMRPRLLRERMSVLERRLDPKVFFRSHRSAIVRLDLVRSIKTISRYEHALVLATGATAPLSRERKAALEEQLSGGRTV